MASIERLPISKNVIYLSHNTIIAGIHVEIEYFTIAMNKLELAKYIIARYPNAVSPLKLQKLLYYCYVWQLVAKNKLFEAEFEAWDYGPVEKEIYNAYKKYGKNPIPIQNGTSKNHNKWINYPLIEFILDSYSVYSAIELSLTTHAEKPWKKYKSTGKIIPDDELISFYSKEVFAKNFPLGHTSTYYPPKTSSHYSFTFDMEEEYVPEFKSLEEYLTSFSKENERLEKLIGKLNPNVFEN